MRDGRIAPRMFCSSCGAQVSADERFCSACGRSLDLNSAATIMSDEPSSDGETIAPAAAGTRKKPSDPPAARPSRTPSSGSVTSSSDPIAGGRFVPGQIIAERYRIVALAGRGGMGEVYRAEDLKLGQVVAIKFLPESLSSDPAALARFHTEVRIARQVSHPNVCRVFDIGEAGGLTLLSMEYVDGEDLASLIRRIGRLSPDKAVEIARQVCAGLAAAHERGVIHRDLKPANLMLDSAGKIRITDFGLAAIAATIQGADVRAGTPAYMAPEQLAGKEVTPKSDLYALGLVLYEILTGKRAFEATTLPELMKLREKSAPTQPSTLVKDLDPLLERVILRCLEKDPPLRPASALQVAAALPGGDPLAAALAAGETPSPEMVVAAVKSEGMRPALALGLVTLVIAGLFASLVIGEHTQLVNRIRLENPPEVLAARARETLANLGVAGQAVDSAYGFDTDEHFLGYTAEHDKTPGRWNVLSADRPSAMVFWYRQSPRLMATQKFFGAGPGGGRVNPADPEMRVTGMSMVVLDTSGRLLHLEIVPPQKDSAAKVEPANWAALFSAASLDQAAFRSGDPEWMPLAWGDSRAAWTGTLPNYPDLPVRIEAAAYRGKPIYFEVIYPWSTPDRSSQEASTRRQDIVAIVLVSLLLLILIGGALVARWNVQQRRGDHRGAIRLGAFVFMAFLATWAFSAHHLPDLQEVPLLFIAASWALLYTFFVGVLYLALEPFVRSREPHVLISWSRLLAGKFRDPLVGRDILIGAVYGIGLLLIEASDNFILPLLGKLPPVPGRVSTDSLLGVHDGIALLLFYILQWMFYSLGIFFLLFILQRLLRKTWLAMVVIAAIGTFLSLGSGEENPLFAAAALILLYSSFLFVLKRFGLLTLVVGLVVQNVLIIFPATTHLSRWYSTPALTGITAIAALSIYAFYTALAGQRLFSSEILDS
jgi:Protein kinase domain/zinc-ribbon domain